MEYVQRCHCPWGAEGLVHHHRPDMYCPADPRGPEPEDAPRCDWAGDDECGVEYRPGQLSIKQWCRLRPGHGGFWHSTRPNANEPTGFEWRKNSPQGEVDWR